MGQQGTDVTWPGRFAGRIFVATDGGAEGRGWMQTAGWGIGVASETGQTAAAVGGWVTGSDRGSWAAEAGALLILLTAALAVGIDLHIPIDNLAVKRQFTNVLAGKCVLSRFGFGLWRRIARLCDGRSHACSWVPSHDKQEHWVPDVSGQDGAVWRRLSNAADVHASRQAKAHQSRRMSTYERACAQAHEWASRYLERVTRSAAVYEESLSHSAAAELRGDG